MTKFLNISVDNNLGGDNASDSIISSQKAIKTYIDSKSGGDLYPIGGLYFTILPTCPLAGVYGEWDYVGTQKMSLYGNETSNHYINVFVRVS